MWHLSRTWLQKSYSRISPPSKYHTSSIVTTNHHHESSWSILIIIDHLISRSFQSQITFSIIAIIVWSCAMIGIVSNPVLVCSTGWESYPVIFFIALLVLDWQWLEAKQRYHSEVIGRLHKKAQERKGKNERSRNRKQDTSRDEQTALTQTTGKV